MSAGRLRAIFTELRVRSYIARETCSVRVVR
jgi:hypothetical protein